MSPLLLRCAVGNRVLTLSPQTLKASKALLSHIKKAAAAKTDTKPNLLADEDSAFAETPIWLTITTKKHIHETQRYVLGPRRCTWSGGP